MHSVLGPIVFIIFINDLMIKNADDTILIDASKTVKELQTKAEEFFDLVTCWFSTNGLILNKGKTHVLIFRTKQCKISKLLKIDLSNKSLDINKNAQFLGRYINGHIM